jgi:preprotein translocase subunit YajC
MAYLLLPILLVLMYVVLLRPQQQRLRSQRQLVASLDVGDEVITAGGIIGRIVALSDDRASIEVADGVVIDFLRVAVNRRAGDAAAGGTTADMDDSGQDLTDRSGDLDEGAGDGGGDGGGGGGGDAGDRPDEASA